MSISSGRDLKTNSTHTNVFKTNTQSLKNWFQMSMTNDNIFQWWPNCRFTDAVQRDNRCSMSSSSNRQCRRTASTVPLLEVWRFVWRMYVPVRILALTTAFFTSVTEESTVFHTICEVPTRKLYIDRYFRVFFVFISHTSCLVQNESWKRLKRYYLPKSDFRDHINTKVNTANRNLGIVFRTFAYIDQEMFLNLYKIACHTPFGICHPSLVSLL